MKECILFTGGPKFNMENKDLIFNEYKKISNFLHSPIRKMGSATLDMGYVAAGRADGFFQRDLNLKRPYKNPIP